jgi:hypothetical protein
MFVINSSLLNQLHTNLAPLPVPEYRLGKQAAILDCESSKVPAIGLEEAVVEGKNGWIAKVVLCVNLIFAGLDVFDDGDAVEGYGEGAWEVCHGVDLLF